MSAQWALYQVLTRLGLRPDAVVGHSSGELLALAAAGVLQADRELEVQLGRLGTIFRGFESSGDVPEARLLAAACSRERLEDLCRDMGSPTVAVAMDNCPHQVVLAGAPREVERIAQRLRQENILWEDLPFARAYHTPSFGAVLAPIAAFFAQLTFRPPSVPVYSCAIAARLPDDPEAIRAWPSLSGRARWRFARRSRSCMPPGCGCLWTLDHGETSPVSWRTSFGVSRHLPSRQTFPAAADRRS